MVLSRFGQCDVVGLEEDARQPVARGSWSQVLGDLDVFEAYGIRYGVERVSI